MSDKQSAKKRSGLGDSPLSLFSPTTDPEERVPVQVEPEPEPESEQPVEKVVSIAKPSELQKPLQPPASQETTPEFLVGVEGSDKESIGLQVTRDVNDWLDEVVKEGRRKHGKKLKKQVIIQAGIELLRSMPVDWTDIGDLDELRAKLSELKENCRGK
ncbi:MULTISPECIES: hypothetical protein [Cyanophyceae]|uniref:hypothetical protein n=1 Tax=Cyanophyceae TaxID=3028117 RepID=UPI001689E8DE|nr:MULTISPECIES: hypothetical protein [Cyanophyceae]MBD1919466.1 hypothetical protein [Phormidium sp. FACHB-77]MBD2054318.1 hypothetical protein [Leptolyngbya sp. FACHB-60]